MPYAINQVAEGVARMVEVSRVAALAVGHTRKEALVSAPVVAKNTETVVEIMRAFVVKLEGSLSLALLRRVVALAVGHTRKEALVSALVAAKNTGTAAVTTSAFVVKLEGSLSLALLHVQR
jgi:hypothetical protein